MGIEYNHRSIKEANCRKVTKEHVIEQAETVVLNAEAEYLNDLVRDYDSLVDERPVEAESALNEIIREKDRQTKGTYDEEEVVIYKIERHGRKT